MTPWEDARRHRNTAQTFLGHLFPPKNMCKTFLSYCRTQTSNLFQNCSTAGATGFLSISLHGKWQQAMKPKHPFSQCWQITFPAAGRQRLTPQDRSHSSSQEARAQLLHLLPSWQFFTARNCSQHDTHHPVSLFPPQFNNLASKGGAKNSTLKNKEHLWKMYLKCDRENNSLNK